jgi:hypothetical protein
MSSVIKLLKELYKDYGRPLVDEVVEALGAEADEQTVRRAVAAAAPTKPKAKPKPKPQPRPAPTRRRPADRGPVDRRIESRKGEVPKVEAMEVSLAARPTQQPADISVFDLEGRPVITSMSDLSAAGDEVVGVNDVLLPGGVSRVGGQDYMFDTPGQAWAADLNSANRHLELARELRAQTGQDPLFMPWTMGPTAIDFSHMPRELMLRYSQANMPKRTQQRLARDIQTVIPEFRELGDPQSLEAFLGATGAQRGQLNRLLDRYRDEGGLGLGAARMAMTDTEQLGRPLTSLRNVGYIAADMQPTPSSHPSYPYSIPGGGIGTLREDIGALDLLPELRLSADPFDFPVGVVRGVPSPLRALQMKPKGAVITQDVLRGIDDRLSVDAAAQLDDAVARQMGTRQTAQATSERVPYRHSGHLPGLLQADDAARAAYSTDPRASWIDEAGNDIIYSALGVPQRPTQQATGFYTPPGGMLETNPATVAKPFVGVSGGDIDPASRETLDLAESLRNYLDAQGAGAYHIGLSDVPSDDLGSLSIPMGGAVDASTLVDLQKLGQSYGLPDVVDTGEAITVTNFAGAPMGSETRRALADEGLTSEIERLTGSLPRRISAPSGYLPVLETAGEAGSGKATSDLLALVNKYPAEVINRLDSDAVRMRAASGAALDDEMAARYGGTREDIQTARRIFAERGFEGLREAAKQGVALPGVAALMSVYGLQPQDPADEGL